MPMHVGGLQLFEPPADAGPELVRDVVEKMREVEEISPLFLKHPFRSPRTGGALVWRNDKQFDIEHHVRHSALPHPGRIRELLELVGRLHQTRLDWARPLWEATLIEGLEDGRVAMYSKIHHGLVDGISAMRLLQSVLSTDPDERDMPPPWAARPKEKKSRSLTAPDKGLSDIPGDVVRSALGITAEAAGMPTALVKTLTRGVRNQTSAVSFHAPRTMFNQEITGARRFAADDWPVERLRAIGKATRTTINDVVLAMCAGAIRDYLLEHDALPEAPVIAMVPVGLKAGEANKASMEGGNAVGSVMVRLATDLPDAGERLRTIHNSMKDGKEALSSMSPAQIIAMSGIGLAPAILPGLLKAQGIVRSPFNLIISNVPGPRTTHYWNGLKLVGNYPVSIPINGMALNITCTSYDGQMGFGLTGCRRTVPQLQRLLVHLENAVVGLEEAAGIA